MTDMDYTVGQKYIGIGCYRTQRGPGIFLHLSLIYINRLAAVSFTETCNWLRKYFI